MTEKKFNKTAIGNLKYLLLKNEYPRETLTKYFQTRGLTVSEIEKIYKEHPKFEMFPQKKPDKKVIHELTHFNELYSERMEVLKRYYEVLEKNKDYSFFKENSGSCRILGDYFVFAVVEGEIVPASLGTTCMSPDLGKERIIERINEGSYRFPPRQHFKKILYYPKKINYDTMAELRKQTLVSLNKQSS